jgi:hypothetical protein
VCPAHRGQLHDGGLHGVRRGRRALDRARTRGFWSPSLLPEHASRWRWGGLNGCRTPEIPRGSRRGASGCTRSTHERANTRTRRLRRRSRCGASRNRCSCRSPRSARLRTVDLRRFALVGVRSLGRGANRDREQERDASRASRAWPRCTLRGLLASAPGGSAPKRASSTRLRSFRAAIYAVFDAVRFLLPWAERYTPRS